jgi:DNA-directed RNA polymerase subunit beta'
MGAEALYKLLERIDLDELSYDLRHKANTETSQQRKNEALKSYRLLKHLEEHTTQPSWNG